MKLPWLYQMKVAASNWCGGGGGATIETLVLRFHEWIWKSGLSPSDWFRDAVTNPKKTAVRGEKNDILAKSRKSKDSTHRRQSSRGCNSLFVCCIATVTTIYTQKTSPLCATGNVCSRRIVELCCFFVAPIVSPPFRTSEASGFSTFSQRGAMWCHLSCSCSAIFLYLGLNSPGSSLVLLLRPQQPAVMLMLRCAAPCWLKPWATSQRSPSDWLWVRSGRMCTLPVGELGAGWEEMVRSRWFRLRRKSLLAPRPKLPLRSTMRALVDFAGRERWWYSSWDRWAA